MIIYIQRTKHMIGGENLNKLKFFRKQEKITQKELAKILNVSTDYISIIERGKQTPGGKLAQRIADVFGVKIDDLNFF